jgi:WD40 repeat protein
VNTRKPIWGLRSEAYQAPLFALSPDGKIVATSDGSTEIVLREAVSGQERFRLQLPRDAPLHWLRTMQFMNGGTALAVLGEQYGDSIQRDCVILWDLASRNVHNRYLLPGERKLVPRYSGPGLRYLNPFFSPDGCWLATDGGKAAIFFHDVSSGRLMRRLTELKSEVNAQGVSPDGRYLATIDARDFTLDLWELASGKVVKQYPLNGQWSRPTFSPDHRTLALSGIESSVMLLDLPTGNARTLPRNNEVFHEALAFSPDGRLLAVGGHSGVIRLWDVATMRETGPLPFYFDTAPAPAGFLPDSRTLLVHSGEQLHFWKLDSPTKKTGPWQAQEQHALPAGWWVLLSSCGTKFVDRIDKHLRLRDVTYGLELHRFLLPGVTATVTLSPKGKFLAVGGDTIDVWNTRTGDRLYCTGSPFMSRVELSFSPDEKTLLVVGEDKEQLRLALLDLDTGKLRARWQFPDQPRLFYRRCEVSWSPDGTMIALMVPSDGSAMALILPQKLLLIDAARGQVLRELKDVCVFAFASDGKTLAVAGNDGVIRLHDPATGKQVGKLCGHEEVLTGLVFSPDGRLLASGSEDGTVLLWDIAAARGLKSES